jgi:hypothetical protein
MDDDEDLGLTTDNNLACDAVGGRFLRTWQWPITFGPFVILVAVAQLPVSNAIPTGLFVALIMIAVVWAVAFQGYLLYLKYQSS